jgi:hypothetical protein
MYLAVHVSDLVSSFITLHCKTPNRKPYCKKFKYPEALGFLSTEGPWTAFRPGARIAAVREFKSDSQGRNNNGKISQLEYL